MERILVIGMSGDCGGIENYLLNMYEHIDRSKIQFDFLVKKPIGQTFQKRIKALGGHIYETGILKENIVRTWRIIRSIYKKENYQKAYVNLSYAPTLLYVLPGLKYNIRQVFIHSHASDDFRKIKHYFFRDILLNIIRKKARLFYVGCSKEACYWMFGRKECEENGYFVIKNAVDHDKYAFNNKVSQQMRKKLNLDNAFVVGHVGRFSEEKNHDFIIRAFYDLHRKKEDTKLLLVGDGYLQNRIKEKVAELGLTNHVVFTGVVNDSEQYYNAMDCFWMPSIFEGLPLVAIEAEANGLCCLFSENITRSVDILKNNYFLPIDHIEGFVLKTLEIRKGYNRDVDWGPFVEAGYDIIHEAKQLELLLIK